MTHIGITPDTGDTLPVMTYDVPRLVVKTFVLRDTHSLDVEATAYLQRYRLAARNIVASHITTTSVGVDSIPRMSYTLTLILEVPSSIAKQMAQVPV